MIVNWDVRLKNKAFWMAVIPAILLLAQQVCALFGITLDVAGVSDQLVAIVGTVFGILALVGVINDPTTAGLSDSERALEYEEPRKD